MLNLFIDLLVLVFCWRIHSSQSVLLREQRRTLNEMKKRKAD